MDKDRRPARGGLQPGAPSRPVQAASVQGCAGPPGAGPDFSGQVRPRTPTVHGAQRHHGGGLGSGGRHAFAGELEAGVSPPEQGGQRCFMQNWSAGTRPALGQAAWTPWTQRHLALAGRALFLGGQGSQAATPSGLDTAAPESVSLQLHHRQYDDLSSFKR